MLSIFVPCPIDQCLPFYSKLVYAGICVVNPRPSFAFSYVPDKRAKMNFSSYELLRRSHHFANFSDR